MHIIHIIHLGSDMNDTSQKNYPRWVTAAKVG